MTVPEEIPMEPVEDNPSDDEMTFPSRRRTSSTLGAPGGDGNGCGEQESEQEGVSEQEKDNNTWELPEHPSQKRRREPSQQEDDSNDPRVFSAHRSQKWRKVQSRREGDNSNDDSHPNRRRSPRKNTKRLNSGQW